MREIKQNISTKEDKSKPSKDIEKKPYLTPQELLGKYATKVSNEKCALWHDWNRFDRYSH